MVRTWWGPIASVAVLFPTVGLAQPAEDDSAYRAATGLLRRDMPEQAIPEYRAFLRDHPDHAKAASARYALAVCLTRTGKWQEAATELDELGRSKDFEFAPDAALLRAQCAVNLKDSAAAIEGLGYVLKTFPAYERVDAAAGLLGETLYREGRGSEAKAILDRFEKEWPTSLSRPRAAVFLALIDSAEGRDAEAADALAAIRKAFPKSEVAGRAGLIEGQCRHRAAIAAKPIEKGQAAKATALYRAAAQDEQLADEAALGLAQLSRATGDAKGAGALLDELLKRSGSGPLAGAARVERARVYLDLDDANRALAVIGVKAESAEAAYWGAKAEIRLGRFDAAAARLSRAIEADPKSSMLPEMLFDRSVALFKAGQAEQARAGYAEMRARFPQHGLAAEALAAEASLMLAAGDGAGAAELCRDFIKSNPSHERAAAVKLLLAESLAQSGNSGDAVGEFDRFLKDHPQDPRAKDAAVRRGLALAKGGKTEEATQSLGAALGTPGAIDPSLERGAAVVLADAALVKSDWRGAEGWLLKATSAPEGRTADALLKLGIALARLNRADEAVGRFDTVMQEFAKDPAAVQAQFERGQIRVEKGQLDTAGRDFEAVIAAEEGSGAKKFTVHALRNLASIASRQGRTEAAADLLGRVAASPEAGSLAADAAYERASALLADGNYPGALSEFEKFIRGNAEHARAADAAAQRAIAMSRLGKFEDAIGAMDEAIARAEAMRPEVLASGRYERAWDLKELKRDEESREAYRQLLGTPIQPALEAHASLDLAQLEIAAGDQEKGMQLLARALKATESADGKLDAVAERALYLRGACLLKAGKAAEASAAAEELLHRFPKSEILVQAELLAGQAALKAGKAEVAGSHLQRVVDAAPADDVLGPALLSLGESLAASHQWQKSQAAFERYLAKLPKSETWFQAQFGIAWALENQGRHAEAVSAYREVVARHNGPTAARAQFQVGECLFAMKQYDDAVRELLKVDILYAYPEWSAAALYEAGRCLGQLNKTAEAQTQFKQVIERFGETQWARLAAQQSAATKPETLPGRTPAAPSSR